MINTVLDHAAAEKAKQEAMAQAYENAPDLWKQHAQQAVIHIATHHAEFTSDEVWKILYKPKNGRALGPVMRTLAVAGYLEPTDRVVKSAQVSRHHAPVSIWKSRIFQGGKK